MLGGLVVLGGGLGCCGHLVWDYWELRLSSCCSKLDLALSLAMWVLALRRASVGAAHSCRLRLTLDSLKLKKKAE